MNINGNLMNNKSILKIYICIGGILTIFFYEGRDNEVNPEKDGWTE
jgi:hypothetical protein